MKKLAEKIYETTPGITDSKFDYNRLSVCHAYYVTTCWRLIHLRVTIQLNAQLLFNIFQTCVLLSLLSVFPKKQSKILQDT